MSTTSRRALLGAATVAGATIAQRAWSSPTITPAVPDPIFAAIERYRAAKAPLDSSMKVSWALDEELPQERQRWHWTNGDPVQPPEGGRRRAINADVRDEVVAVQRRF